MSDNILQDDLILDWTLMHGRSGVLQVVMDNSPSMVYKQDKML